MQIGVDFGGTKIEAAALGPDGRFLARRRMPNPGIYDAALETVRTLVETIESDIGERATVGVGMPGSMSLSSDTIRNANSVWLNGRRFRDDLVATLGRNVRVANDANCLALSEASDGATKGAAVAFAVILGTGCGGGLTINGRLIEGANGIGGEWGHMPLPWPSGAEVDGPLCWCGKRGCLETWISGSGLSRDYEQATGMRKSAQEIAAAARTEGVVEAVAALDRYIHRLGRALAVVCNIVDPEVIVLGGGLSNAPEIYARVPDIVAGHVFSDEWRSRIVPARWGDSSGVRGAARLWPVANPAEPSVFDVAAAKAR